MHLPVIVDKKVMKNITFIKFLLMACTPFHLLYCSSW